jgi:hypothetical protein
VTAPWDQRSLDEQARVEALTLARWLPVATSAAPHWEHEASAAGLTPSEAKERSDLYRLRPSREADLLADGPGAPGTVLRPSEDQVKALGGAELLTRVASAIRRDGGEGKREVLLREYQPLELHRAGPDRRLLVASSRSDLDRLHRAGARAARVLGLDEHDVLLDAVPTGPTIEAVGVTHLAQGASITALHARGHGDDLATVAAAARLLPVTVLTVPLEDAVTLGRTLAGARIDLRRLRRIVTLGPLPDAETRGEIAAAFTAVGANADVRALWGPDLGRSLWAECAEGHHGLHTTPDLELLEVVDPMSGQPTDGDGDLTITTMGWHGTVLLRVQTGTWVDPLTMEPCPGCGRTVPRVVGEMAPRAWQLPMTPEGSRARHVDLRGVPSVLASTTGVAAWRAELRGPTDRVPGDRLVVEIAGELTRSERTDLEERLELACGVAPHLAVGVHRAAIERAIDELGGVFADLR